MENPETLTFKLLGVFEMSASGSFAVGIAAILATALIVRAYR